MATKMGGVIQHLCRLALRDGDGTTDGQLLTAFVRQRDETALATLVDRHGPMVWGVCRRLLRNHHDAEDAFQATFLVLVHKAAAVREKEAVANWLYGVAHQTAVRVRATVAKRQGREQPVKDMAEPAAKETDLGHDLLPLLDQELTLLPDKYRVLIVLCDLEGKTRKEVARRLGCPEGTVAGRLARARTMLANRLRKHGLTMTGAALAVTLSQKMASACVPASLVTSTTKAVTLTAAGQAMAGVISAKVAALTQGVLKTMLLTKLKAATTAVFLMLGMAGLGAGLLTHGMASARQGGDGVKKAPDGAKVPAEGKGTKGGKAAGPPKSDSVKVEVEGSLGVIVRQANTDFVTATVVAGGGEFVIDASGSKPAQKDLVRLADKYIKMGSTVIISPRLKVTGRLEFRATKVVGEKGEMSDGPKAWVLVADSVALLIAAPAIDPKTDRKSIPAGRPDDAASWSKPTRGLHARIALAEQPKINGTRSIVPYLELQNVSGNADRLKVRCDTGHVKFELVDADGKAVRDGHTLPRSGPHPDPGTIVLPLDSEMRIGMYCSNWGAPEDAAAMISTDSGAWVLRAKEKGKVFLRATVKGAKVESDPDRMWYGTIVTPPVKVDWKE